MQMNSGRNGSDGGTADGAPQQQQQLSSFFMMPDSLGFSTSASVVPPPFPELAAANTFPNNPTTTTNPTTTNPNGTKKRKTPSEKTPNSAKPAESENLDPKAKRRAQIAKAARKHRQRQKDELDFLRRKVKDLNEQVEILKNSEPSDHLTETGWKEEATGHANALSQIDRENEYLRNTLMEQLKFTEKLQEMLKKQPLLTFPSSDSQLTGNTLTLTSTSNSTTPTLNPTINTNRMSTPNDVLNDNCSTSTYMSNFPVYQPEVATSGMMNSNSNNMVHTTNSDMYAFNSHPPMQQPNNNLLHFNAIQYNNTSNMTSNSLNTTTNTKSNGSNTNSSRNNLLRVADGAMSECWDLIEKADQAFIYQSTSGAGNNNPLRHLDIDTQYSINNNDCKIYLRKRIENMPMAKLADGIWKSLKDPQFNQQFPHYESSEILQELNESTLYKRSVFSLFPNEKDALLVQSISHAKVQMKTEHLSVIKRTSTPDYTLISFSSILEDPNFPINPDILRQSGTNCMLVRNNNNGNCCELLWCMNINLLNRFEDLSSPQLLADTLLKRVFEITPVVLNGVVQYSLNNHPPSISTSNVRTF